MKKILLPALIAAFFALSSFASDSPKKPEVACFYYAHWHKYPKGEEWFGKGWTEYELLRTAKPKFEGHKQPLRPPFGNIAGDNPKDVELEIELASNAGIDVFVNCWYWYDGKRTMEEAVEKGFLKASNRDKMKFALMWANHDRKDQFRPDPDKPRRVLMANEFSEADLTSALEYCAEHYFKEPNYWKIDGKSYFGVYMPKPLIAALGGAANTRAILSKIDALMKSKGCPPIHWAANCTNLEDAKLCADAGFVSLFNYNVSKSPAPKTEYDVYTDNMRQRWRLMEKSPIPYQPVVGSGWDCTPRCVQSVPWPYPRKFGYPYGTVVVNNTPEKFGKVLRDASDWARKNNSFAVFINAWNEYTEGAFLLPADMKKSYPLAEVADVFGRRPADLLVEPNFFKNPKLLYFPMFDKSVKYGPHFRNVIRFWKSKAPSAKNSKTPLLFYIHGGGWSNGFLCDVHLSKMIRKLLDSGISVASADYRFLKEAGDLYPPVKAPIGDAARALQFVRAHADDWGIDPANICLAGGSAGAFTSLWLATHPDLADPSSPDHIARQSTKPQAAVVFVPQTTLDPKLGLEWTPNLRYGSGAFGCKWNDFLKRRDELLPLILEYSPYHLLSKDTPPITIINNSKFDMGKPARDPTHSPNFSHAFKLKCDSLGVPCNDTVGQYPFYADLIIKALKK